jgi:C4-dicarboxylate transporter DctM subunit
MSPLVIFFIGLAVFLMFAFLGIPLAFAFGIVGFVGFAYLRGLDAGLSMLGQAPWQWASDSGLIVVPLFILMGQFAFHSGISRDLYVATYRWMGKLPGGLALATNLACTGFAACTGSSLASGATMGTIAYPEMMRFKYSELLATGCIASGGTLGILIPPSIVFIIYGFLTQQPIGTLFIAGILPGLLLSGLFLVTILTMCILKPELGPRGESFSWKEKFASLTGIWGMLVLFFLVIGGLYLGVFAPSEAGAMGAIGAFVIALSRRMKAVLFIKSLKDSLRLTCMTITILIGAMIFSCFVTVSGVPTMFATWVTELQIPSLDILLLILAIYVPLGMVLDALSMVLLTVPTVFPIIHGLGFDPIWFGVLLVLVVEMALITPPVGMIVYIVHGVTRVPLVSVFKGNLPFLGAMIIALLLIVLFPQICLFLPNTMR